LFEARKQKHCTFNVTIRETKALNNLHNNKDITIKKADKNSGIVIMNTIDYYNKVITMLNDPNVYTIVNNYDITTVKRQSDELAIELLHSDCINNKQFKYITNYIPKCPIFYGMPKIHKKDCPLRPIVSQINGPTYRINQLIHELLMVAENEIPYLFKDTTTFLNTIEKHKLTLDDTILVTMDVVSLYTNIPHNQAVEYVTSYYEETLTEWHKYDREIQPVSIEMLKKLLEFMLNECTFEFNNIYYRQNYGCPMGAPASVRIANIYMYVFLRNFFTSYIGPKPPFVGRLIDDIFLLWNHQEAELLTLFSALNNYHTTIKFEINYSSDSVNFLDTTVYKVNNEIHTKLYIKPTDKKQYLHYSSCHPLHVKKAIPFSQALRYRRIIDVDEVLKESLDNLCTKFTTRGYNDDTVKTNISRALETDRLETLKYRNKEQSSNQYTTGMFLPLIITYCFKYDNIQRSLQSSIHDLWKETILKNEKLKECFGDTFPKIIYKKGPTISDKLINASYRSNADTVAILDTTVEILVELNAEQNLTATVSKCNRKTCKCCLSITTGNSFKSTITNKEYTIAFNMSCNSTDVIYLITCAKCNKQYIGETKRKLKERITNHRSTIKLKKPTAVSIHFNDILHNINHLTVQPIEIAQDLEYRKFREDYWINELNCKYPFGLNCYPIVNT